MQQARRLQQEVVRCLEDLVARVATLEARQARLRAAQPIPTTWRLAVAFQLSGPGGRLPIVRQVRQGCLLEGADRRSERRELL
eukprot:3438715-Prymnesium_polylepis.2